MKKIDQCPICGSKLYHKVLICKDYLVSGKDFEITACDECGFLFTNPRPEDDKLNDYYQSEDYISHSESKKGLINRLYLLARNFTLKNKLKIIKKYSEGNRLLDIGCGTGSFISVCKSAGYKVLGIEPNKNAREYGIKNYGIEIKTVEDFIRLDENSIDIITLWHVLEHVSDFRLYFKKFKEILSTHGTLFIALPNPDSKDAQIYHKFWAAYDVPRHLYHFRQTDIKNVATQFGFYLKATIPMKLDAYYISMLSEKYKYGKNNIIKALFNGMKSNLWARKHNNNYSSLIYIFKHKV